MWIPDDLLKVKKCERVYCTRLPSNIIKVKYNQLPQGSGPVT